MVVVFIWNNQYIKLKMEEEKNKLFEQYKEKELSDVNEGHE